MESGQIMIFHQPIDFPEIRGPISQKQSPPFGGSHRSCQGMEWSVTLPPGSGKLEAGHFQIFHFHGGNLAKFHQDPPRD